MITTNWDYTQLADAYVKRPAYSEIALDKMCALMKLSKDSQICDIGAGTGHLAIPLARRSFQIKAIEPNDAMRVNGIQIAQNFNNVSWEKGTAESTNQPEMFFDAVTFGSSFNVCDQNLALKEAKRICKKQAWFACMWNHRDLNDPIQKEIENIIKNNIPNYNYGSRREDPSKILEKSNLFNKVISIEQSILHAQLIEDIVEAWRSHGTLHKQAGNKFESIIDDIAEYLDSLGQNSITIPYTTRMWIAQFLG